MKIILDGKYVVPMDVLSRIVEVEEIGPYGSRSFKILGEPQQVEIVQDNRVVDGEKGEEIVNANAVVELEKVKKQLAKAELLAARKDAVERILAEKQRLSADDVGRFVATKTMAYYLPALTSEDVKKFLRLETTEVK